MRKTSAACVRISKGFFWEEDDDDFFAGGWYTAVRTFCWIVGASSSSLLLLELFLEWSLVVVMEDGVCCEVR